MNTRQSLVLIVGLGLAAPAGGTAQSLADRVAAAPDGRIRLSYTARPGVCGDGRNIRTTESNSDWISDCESGPARVVLTKEREEIVRVRTYVGGHWRDVSEGVTDLGFVDSPVAASFLLDLVETANERASREAVLPATLAADAVVWPRLLGVAGDETRPRRTRQAALQWAGIEAGDVLESAARASIPLDDDREARERAVFAISQLPKDEAVPKLIDIAETHRYAHIRQKALFWLGQSGDPRAVEVLTEVLQGR
jgi:HEAT repeats